MKTNYGNWISNKAIRRMKAITLVPALLTILLFYFDLKVLAGLAGALFLLTLYYTIVFKRAQIAFSDEGGKVMDQILDYVLSKVPDKNYDRILDIGCGSGKLTIKIKKKFPQAEVSGMDYWDEIWEYSKKLCNDNAKAEGVEKIFFEKGDAAKLSFPDETFDLVVSNFVFHEVRGVKDKKEVIKEALRVTKTGGFFVFHDLFFQKKYYGSQEELIAFLDDLGLKEYKLEETINLDFIPSSVKNPILLKEIGILYGEK